MMKCEREGGETQYTEEREKTIKILYANATVRAITSIDVKLCKMEKGAHFTQFEQKKPTSMGVNLCINASCYSTRANMHKYCSMCI